MEQKVKLIYTLDEKNSIKTTLKEGTPEEIDSLTLQFENSKELRIAFKEQIEYLRKSNEEYINNAKRTETGDIVIINQNNKRIRVLYKRHIRVFNEIIENDKFLEYLAQNYINIYELLDENAKYAIYSNSLIRKIYGIYKDEYKEKIKIKKEKQATEEEFSSSLIEDQYTKKLGGM